MMHESFRNKILYTFLLCTLTFVSGICNAADTEIYFNSTANNPAVRPNVLFILDTSGSMAWGTTSTFSTPSRMAQMQSALNTIFNSLEGVNVGLMRFNGDSGGSVLFPIAYINDPISNYVSENDVTEATYNYTLADDNADAQELVSSGAVTLIDSSMTVPQIPAVYANGSVTSQVGASSDDAYEYGGAIYVPTDNVVAFFNTGTFIQGIRFGGLTIPNGATIDSATLDLYSYTITDSNTTNITLYGEGIDDSLAFDSTNPTDISTRPLTTSSVGWSNVPSNTTSGVKVTSPDLSPIVQEIVDRSGWSSGNALSLIIPQAQGTRRYYSFDGAAGNTSLYPTLNVNYTYVATPAQDKITAYHYTGVQIPQGAKITGATLTFNTTSSASGDGAVWTIQADDSDNSAAITSTNGDLSSRSRTSAKVNWTLPDFTSGQTYTTCTDGSCADGSGSSVADITSVLQEVVDRSGWCGGNDLTFLITGTGSRTITTHEQDAGNAPALSITYDKAAGGGCYKDSVVAQVINSSDDAEESSNGTTDTNNSTINMSSDTVGFRFTDIQIPQGSTITNATVSVRQSICSWRRCSSQTSGDPTVSVQGELIDDSPAFTGGRSNNNITNRTTTSASVNWNIGDFTSDGTWLTSPDISSVIGEIVGQGGWSSGNALSLIIGSDSQARSIDATDGSGSAGAAMLNITFTSTAGASQAKTVRERLKELVNEMPSDGVTPIVEALYEATHYWRGESVVHGKARGYNLFGSQSSTRISHPASYCDADNSCNGADTTNYPPYGINEPSGCSSDNLTDSNCSARQIEGSPKYISPFSSDLTCVSNYQVLLTDGDATENDDASLIRNEYLGGASCQSTFSDGSSVSSDEECGVDLAKFLHDNDQSSSLDNDQTVKTYTVGFTLSTQFLKDLATDGGGTFSEAGDETDLINTLNSILTNVRDDPTSFVSPSLATNAFNRLLSRDEVYFGLFTPSMDQSWNGNVKKYNICVNSGGADGNISTTADNCTLGEILDANGDPAIDPATDKFSSTAQSVWTGQIDGLNTTFGGAGGEMTDYTQRVIYTDATSSGSEPASGTALNTTVSGDSFKLTTGTWDSSTTSQIRDLLCPINSTDTTTTDGQTCQDHIFWLLGKIINPNPTTDVSATNRWAFNDVLHSSPAVITYGGSDSNSDGVIDTYFDKIVVGTNEGAIRFINGTTGKEEWAFIPQELMPALQSHYENVEGDHLYGMDVTPTIRVIDVNQDGIIDPTYDNNGDGTFQAGEGDKVYLYMAMRRGGNSIYALDVTPSATLTDNTTTIVPKFLWRIQGGTGDFTRLTNTWSQPRLATIGIISGSATVEKQVLIFGGGYDDSLDSLDNNGAGPDYNFGLEGGKPNLGNAVYIVDADTGALIFSISNAADSSLGIAASGADIEVPYMYYSIPSRITALDTTGDGLVNRLYFGDTAGQIWRVDLADVKTGGSANEGNSVVGRLASLSTAGTASDERRFFDPPAVTQVRDTIYSDITGGEYDYVMIGSGNRAHPLNTDVHDRFYAIRDKFPDAMPVVSAGDNLADTTQYPNGGNGVITNSDLIDVTSRVLDSSNTTDLASLGWYIDFNSMGTSGEKVLSAPTAIAGAAFFTTYEPAVTSNDPCKANIGGGYAYNLNILSAKAQVDWDEDGTLEDVADRKLTLGGGIPSDVVPVFTKEGVVGIVGIEGGAAQLGTLSGLPRYRTYWYQEK